MQRYDPEGKNALSTFYNRGVRDTENPSIRGLVGLKIDRFGHQLSELPYSEFKASNRSRFSARRKFYLKDHVSYFGYYNRVVRNTKNHSILSLPNGIVFVDLASISAYSWETT